MVGLRTPGPINEEPLNTKGSRQLTGRHTEAGPIGMSKGGGRHRAEGAGPTLRGWPRNITWSQFRNIRSRPDGESEDAQIGVGVFQPEEADIRRDGDDLFLAGYRINVRVVSAESWAVTSAKTDVLLAHEQVHFDIVGLGGQGMVRELSALRVHTAGELQAEVTRIIQRYDNLMDTVSDQYDLDTDHSRNHSEQERWERHIHHLIEDSLTLSVA